MYNIDNFSRKITYAINEDTEGFNGVPEVKGSANLSGLNQRENIIQIYIDFNTIISYNPKSEYAEELNVQHFCKAVFDNIDIADQFIDGYNKNTDENNIDEISIRGCIDHHIVGTIVFFANIRDFEDAINNNKSFGYLLNNTDKFEYSILYHHISWNDYNVSLFKEEIGEPLTNNTQSILESVFSQPKIYESLFKFTYNN